MKRDQIWNRAAIPAFLLLTTLTGSAARAEDVQWRYDYNTARREATEKGMPLLLDFTTENCFWCVKLDTTTFRDPVISRTLNERFVPLKVDASANAALTEALRIHSFPTLVFAAPDGKIINMLEGYLDAPRFNDQLQRVVSTVNNPEWMVRDYNEAVKAVTASDYARALALLKGVVHDGQNRPIQAKAKQVIQNVEQQATVRLAHARQLEDKGQTNEAMEALTEVLKVYGGTQAASDAGQMLGTMAVKPEVKLQQRTRRARELLAQAQDEYKNKQYLCCLDRCEILASGYADLPEGMEATKLSDEIKNNPEWMRQACETLTDRLGVLYLSLADTWIKKGQPQQAALCLERVVQILPGTRQADLAQSRLAQLQGQPSHTNFKKP